MPEGIKNIGFYEIFLISSGAILGSWIRFCLGEFFLLIFSKKYFGTLIINTIATFLLSLIWTYSFNNHHSISDFLLFYSTGFLGSLSTFSTYIIEVFQAAINKYWFEAIFIACSSLIISFVAGWIGLLLVLS